MLGAGKNGKHILTEIRVFTGNDSAVRIEDAAQNVQQRSFPNAVWPYKRSDGMLRDLETDVT